MMIDLAKKRGIKYHFPMKLCCCGIFSILLTLSLLFFMQEKAADAEELDPDLFVQYLAKPGEVYRAQGRFAEAEQEYRRQIQTDPGQPLLRNELGIALIGQRRFNEALQEFSEAIRIDPTYAMADANRGVVNVEMHQLDDAVRDFRKALELEPKNSGFHAKLGFAWFQLGRVDDAIAEYDEALRLDPGNEQARRNRSYIMVGRPSPGPRGAP